MRIYIVLKTDFEIISSRDLVLFYFLETEKLGDVFYLPAATI